MHDVNHFGILESKFVSDEAKFSQELVEDLTPFSKLYLTRFILALTIIPTLSITFFAYLFNRSVSFLFVIFSIYFALLIFCVETNFQKTLDQSNSIQRFIFNLTKQNV